MQMRALFCTKNLDRDSSRILPQPEGTFLLKPIPLLVIVYLRPEKQSGHSGYFFSRLVLVTEWLSRNLRQYRCTNLNSRTQRGTHMRLYIYNIGALQGDSLFQYFNYFYFLHSCMRRFFSLKILFIQKSRKLFVFSCPLFSAYSQFLEQIDEVVKSLFIYIYIYVPEIF